MAELSDLYSERILALAAATSRNARLPAPDASATVQSKLCGSIVSVDLVVRDGRVADYGQAVKACLLGQASAAVMAAHVIGSTPADLRAVGRRMRAMLKQNGAPPDGAWADLAALEPVREVRGRHASTLLVFDAVERALADIEARQSAAVS
jgi:NifU-like protein involved in Fe-S cluster formation